MSAGRGTRLPGQTTDRASGCDICGHMPETAGALCDDCESGDAAYCRCGVLLDHGDAGMCQDCRNDLEDDDA